MLREVLDIDSVRKWEPIEDRRNIVRVPLLGRRILSRMILGLRVETIDIVSRMLVVLLIILTLVGSLLWTLVSITLRLLMTISWTTGPLVGLGLSWRCAYYRGLYRLCLFVVLV